MTAIIGMGGRSESRRRPVILKTLAGTAAICLGSGQAWAQSADASTSATPPAETQAPATDAAQDEGSIGEIVVTAQKRPENVQDVPLAITAMSGQMLQERQIVNLRDLVTMVPSVTFQETGGFRTGSVSIRGIGNGGNAGIDAPIGVFFDGVYQATATTAFSADFLDVAAVEVLRGPQAVIFGRNTPVGAINIRTRPPQERFEAMVQAGIGNYDTRYVRGFVGGGLAPNLAARISAYTNSHSGFDYNYSTQRHTNDDDRWGVRGQVAWTPSSSFTGTFAAYFYRQVQNCCTADVVDPSGPFGILTLNPTLDAATIAATGRPYLNVRGLDHRVDEAANVTEENNQAGASFTAAIDLPGGQSITSISAWTQLRNGSPYTASLHQPFLVQAQGIDLASDTYSQEIRLISPSSARVQYLVGLYYYHQDTSVVRTTTALTGANRVFVNGQITPFDTQIVNGELAADNIAAFSQLTWNITQSFRLAGGARLGYDRKRGSNIANTPFNLTTDGPASPAFNSQSPTYAYPDLRTSSTDLSWMASAQFDITEDVLSYVTYSTGYQAGGFSLNTLPTTFSAGTSPVFEPMHTRNVEVGLKTVLFDRRLRFNIDAYQLNIEGYQESLRPPGAPGFIVANGSDRRIRGIEFDGQIAPVEHLSINFQGAFLDSRITSFENGPCPLVGPSTPGSVAGTCSYTGRRPSFSPVFSGSIGAQWSHPVSSDAEAFIGGDVFHTSSQYTEPTLPPNALQRSYELVNLRAGVRFAGDRAVVSLYVKNLFDVAYVMLSSNPSGRLVGINPPAFTQQFNPGLTGWVGPPRRFGIEASYRF
jgi:iron complex outermembrane recepter protein